LQSESFWGTQISWTYDELISDMLV